MKYPLLFHFNSRVLDTDFAIWNATFDLKMGYDDEKHGIVDRQLHLVWKRRLAYFDLLKMVKRSAERLLKKKRVKPR